MAAPVWFEVVCLFGIIAFVNCEQYPDFFSEKQLTEIFGRGGFNREHPYRPKPKPDFSNRPRYTNGKLGSPPVDVVRPYPKQENLMIPNTMTGSQGPGRQGPNAIPPEERLFPVDTWRHRDSNHDMNELPKRLTLTHKWPEFLGLIKEEAKKHPPGQIMPNWEEDIEKWSGYSRQLLVRDNYAKEKALRASKEKEKKERIAAEAITYPPPPRPTPESGMEMYWANAGVTSERKAITSPKPSIFITPKPFYTYNRPSGARRNMPGVGEPGYPLDDEPTYAGEENPRKWGAMPGIKNNLAGEYIGDKPSLRTGALSNPDYSADYPIGHSSNMNFPIPGEAEYKSSKAYRPRALRTGGMVGGPPTNVPEGPSSFVVPSKGSPGYTAPASGYGGYGGPPGPGSNPGYGGYPSPGTNPAYGRPQGPAGSPGYGGAPGGYPDYGGPPGPPGNPGYGGRPNPGFRGPPGLGGQTAYNPGRTALRNGAQPDYPDYGQTLPNERAITSQGMPEEYSKTESPEAELKGYDRMWADLEKKFQPSS